MEKAVYRWKQMGDLLLMVGSGGEVDVNDLTPTNELHRTNKVVRGIFVGVGTLTMSAKARKLVAEAMQDHKSYVITDNTIVRGMIKAMNWLGQPMKAASPQDVP